MEFILSQPKYLSYICEIIIGAILIIFGIRMYRQGKKIEKAKIQFDSIPYEPYTEVDFGFKSGPLKIGDKVICKSNEPDGYMIGHIKYFYDCEGKWRLPKMLPKSYVITYIIEESTGKEWGIMGVVAPYSEELENELKNYYR